MDGNKDLVDMTFNFAGQTRDGRPLNLVDRHRAAGYAASGVAEKPLESVLTEFANQTVTMLIQNSKQSQIIEWHVF